MVYTGELQKDGNKCKAGYQIDYFKLLRNKVLTLFESVKLEGNE